MKTKEQNQSHMVFLLAVSLAMLLIILDYFYVDSIGGFTINQKYIENIETCKGGKVISSSHDVKTGNLHAIGMIMFSAGAYFGTVLKYKLTDEADFK